MEVIKMFPLYYPVGAFGWRLAARAGLPLCLNIDLSKDAEAGVLLASSRDLPGMHVEGETLDEVLHEARYAAGALIDLAVHSRRPPKTQFRIDGADICAV